MLSLTLARKRELKALSHSLHPVVMIGKSGLSDSVIDELNRALDSHELIKIKAQIDDRLVRDALLEEICNKLDSASVQHIGKIFVIYRPNAGTMDAKTDCSGNKKTKRVPFRTKRSYQN